MSNPTPAIRQFQRPIVPPRNIQKKIDKNDEEKVKEDHVEIKLNVRASEDEASKDYDDGGTIKTEVSEPSKRRWLNCKRCKRRKRCKCCTCKSCCNWCCPYFPRCCDLTLKICLQILAVVDLVVASVNIGIWVYLHQYDPFAVNNLGISNKTDLFVSTTERSKGSAEEGIHIAGTHYFPADFHETTTSIYGKEIGNNIEVVGDVIRYSKIGYEYRRYQQEVENQCGRKYYSKHLLGHSLTLTNGVFLDLLIINYVTELAYQFIDISILVTTCCYFEYTSGRLYLIIMWNMELLPVLGKLYCIVESRSQRLCILQYGLGNDFRGLDAMITYHFIPLMIFRGYILLVFTYFVNSLLELGNLEHQTRIQGETLHEYVDRHNEFLRMNKNRSRSNSENEDIRNNL